MFLFGEEEDFGKINSLYFFNIESLKNFYPIFGHHFQELIQLNLKIRKIFSDFANKEPLEILETFFKSEIFFRK